MGTERKIKAKFRPCIDLHDGKVKQIVGGTLTDDGASLKTNFVASETPAYFAKKYAGDGLCGGHVIMLGPGNEGAAREALAAAPGTLQVGGGISDANATMWLEAGAQKIIVTSWLFEDGKFSWERLAKLSQQVGRDRIVVDLSPRQVEGRYFAAINRWQTVTDLELTDELFDRLGEFAGEFLIHGVNVEGRQQGIDETLVANLAKWCGERGLAVTYAGGIASLEDVVRVDELGLGKVDFTVGSALDIFGGRLPYDKVVKFSV